jgi:6-phosphogluconolactonase (cycloisomerase 2 family)
MSMLRRPPIRAVAFALGAAALWPGAAAAQSGTDLRDGAVFSATNGRSANKIVAFDRRSDGRLVKVGTFATGGKGSGSFEDSANGLVLASRDGEQSPNNLGADGHLLIATNSGSMNVTVFRVLKNRLRRIGITKTGFKPVSVTVNRGLLYVLNSGEVENRLNPPNCATGFLPTVTGFRLAASGTLTPIADSTRRLSENGISGCAQVSFNPAGDTLVATERAGRTPEQAPGDEGLIITWPVNEDGTLGDKRVIDAAGEGPFGFTFTRSGLLLTTEQFDGPSGPGRGALTSYSLNGDRTLTPRSASVGNGGTDTCWVVVNNDDTVAFVVSFFDGGRISTYSIAPDGTLGLLKADAAKGTADGAADVTLSRDSRYLYNVNAATGLLTAYRVRGDGGLSLIERERVAPPSKQEATLGLAGS